MTIAIDVAESSPVNAASFEVGYSSPSQSSREFKRSFGEPPSRVRTANGALA